MGRPVLQLVKSYNAANYPFRVRIDMNVDSKKVPLDALSKKLPFYSTFKETSYFQDRKLKIIAVLAQGGIDDYTLLRVGNCIDLGLKNEDDRPILLAGLKPENAYSTDFIMGNTGWSNGRLRRARRDVQDIFNQTAIGKKVMFEINKERKTIRITANNGNDFVSFWGTARLIEKANNITFQSYIA